MERFNHIKLESLPFRPLDLRRNDPRGDAAKATLELYAHRKQGEEGIIIDECEFTSDDKKILGIK